MSRIWRSKPDKKHFFRIFWRQSAKSYPSEMGLPKVPRQLFLVLGGAGYTDRFSGVRANITWSENPFRSTNELQEIHGMVLLGRKVPNSWWVGLENVHQEILKSISQGKIDCWCWSFGVTLESYLGPLLMLTANIVLQKSKGRSSHIWQMQTLILRTLRAFSDGLDWWIKPIS